MQRALARSGPALRLLQVSASPPERLADLGCDAVLVASAVTRAAHPLLVAKAMRLAAEAGRDSYLARRIPRRWSADASSSYEGMLDGMV